MLVIDYFFRGRLEISLPDDGVYGIVDHSSQKTPDTDGFRTIKLKLKNTTPAVPAAQSMAGGRLVAVVKSKV